MTPASGQCLDYQWTQNIYVVQYGCRTGVIGREDRKGFVGNLACDTKMGVVLEASRGIPGARIPQRALHNVTYGLALDVWLTSMGSRCLFY